MAASRTSKFGDLYVPRVVSFIVLLAIMLLVGIVFFRVMAQFIVPLFLACVLLVVFQPLHRWFFSKFPKWPRLAALLTTFTILFTVLAPTIYLGWNAYHESAIRIEDVNKKSEAKSRAAATASATANPVVPTETSPVVVTPGKNTLYGRLLDEAHKWTEMLNERTGVSISREKLEEFFQDALAWVGDVLPLVAGAAIRILIGLVIMIIALYYFFADGPAMINGLMSTLR